MAHVRLFYVWDLGELGEAVGKAIERHRNTDTFFGGFEHDEDRVRAGRQGLDQRVVKHDFGDAPVWQAAHEGNAAHVLAVDIEAQAVGQEHAERSEYAQETRFTVGGAQDNDGKPDIGLILGHDVLDDGALLGAGAGGVSQLICQSPYSARTVPWAKLAPVRAVKPAAAKPATRA